MRDAVIDRQFQHLRIDHDQPALLRRQPVEQRQDHGVDADRLARAGGAGDPADAASCARSAMTGSPPMVLPSASVSSPLVPAKSADWRASRADRRFRAWRWAARCRWRCGRARRRRGGDRAHRAGDVVGKADDARGFDARRRLEFVQRDHRAGAGAEALRLARRKSARTASEGLATHLMQRLRVGLIDALLRCGQEQFSVGEIEVAAERMEGAALAAFAFSRSCVRRRDVAASAGSRSLRCRACGRGTCGRGR